MQGLEQAAREYLNSNGFNCAYYATDPIQDGLVTVQETNRPGSSRFIGRTMLTFQAWASSRGKSEKLANDALDAIVGRGAYESAYGLAYSVPNIISCSPGNGPYRWDDPDVKELKRWQFTVEVDYNG